MGWKWVEIPEDELRRLYLDEKLPPATIAKIFGCNDSTVRNRLREYGIKVRTLSEAMTRIVIPEDDLRRLYLDEGLSAEEIAKIYGCSGRTVFDRLRKYGINTRCSAIKIPEDKLRQLYLDEELSSCKIAEIFGCSDGTVRNNLQKYGIKARSRGEAIAIVKQKYPRCDFSGNPIERAYLIGFRSGDLHVMKRRKEGRTITVHCGTTTTEQIELIKELFEPYGHVWVAEKLDKAGSISIQAYLNMTFAFLLPKEDNIPAEILEDDRLFAAYLAGYIDAEGSIRVSTTKCNRKEYEYANFTLSSCDKNILHQIHAKLVSLGIECPAPKIDKKRGDASVKGTKYNQDLWRLGVNAQDAVQKLFDLITPYLKHAKRKADLEKARAVLKARSPR